MSKTFLYETSSLSIQYGLIPELVVGNETVFFVEAILQDPTILVSLEKAEPQLHHIKDAIYEAVGFVYTKTNDNAFIDFGLFKGKHIRISQYTNIGAVVLGEWYIPGTPTPPEPEQPDWFKESIVAWYSPYCK